MALTDVLPPDESIFEDKEHVEFLQVVSNELSSTSTARLWIWSREGQDWIERVKNAIQLQEDAELRLLQAVLKRHFLSLQIAAAISRGVAAVGANKEPTTCFPPHATPASTSTDTCVYH